MRFLALAVIAAILFGTSITVSASIASDEQQIKQLVVAKNHVPPGRKVKFFPIKITDGWAKACFVVADVGPSGNEIHVPGSITDERDLAPAILKKIDGKWNIVFDRYLEGMTPTQCRQIGLPIAIAKRIGVVVFEIADQTTTREIRREVLRATHFTGEYKYDGGVAKTQAKFEPIKVYGGWASAYYDLTSKVKGLETIPNEESYVLKRTGSQWHAIYACQGGMQLRECKRIGLSPDIARRVGIQIGPDIPDADVGHVMR